MPVEEQLATIFEMIEGGAETTAEVIPFPTDAGATALEGTTTTVELGNGIATEVSQLTVTEAGTTTTAGVGLLAMDVGTVGVAIAPALGILAGVGLYSLAPEFWTNVSNTLLDAGETIGGKVRAYINGETKEVGFSAQTIEIFKNAFLEAGLFNETRVEPEIPPVGEPYTLNSVGGGLSDAIKGAINMAQQYNMNIDVITTRLATIYADVSTNYPQLLKCGWEIRLIRSYNKRIYAVECMIDNSVSPIKPISIKGHIGQYLKPLKSINFSGVSNKVLTYSWEQNGSSFVRNISTQMWFSLQSGLRSDNDEFVYTNANVKITPSPYVQPNATYPAIDPFPQTYPTWNPWSVPVEGFPDVYPIEIPILNPEADQSEAQNPDPLPNNNPDLLPWFIETFPQPRPNPNPYPEPSVNPDPDPAPEPEPIPDPEPEPTPENPVDPNPTPEPSPLPVVPNMPDTVESNAMFTVYKPSMAQVNAFGGWLWSSSIVEAIKRIWQNPLDGIISFMKVYVDAPTSGSDTIKVGILDSGVSAPVVSDQFVTVECGSLNVKEKFYNATDYSPFVGMHLYLPFIGIVELDIDEFMSGEIKVTYHLDVYTGTCLAEVKSRRSPDMPEWTIVYTFSGNASQQLPLTSAEFSGALSSLVGVVGGGLAIASGGGLGLLSGASGIAHAVSHEMVHLAHSGSLSANAGIMGSRKPYLILTRRRGYDANGYNELYGYPSNKTVYLNNCSGYVKVKDIRLETVATDSERIEIESLLKAGVII